MLGREELASDFAKRLVLLAHSVVGTSELARRMAENKHNQ